MKKGDIIIVLTVLSAAFIVLLCFLICGANAKTVKISKNNEVVHNVPLSNDAIFDLETNIIKIEKGRVWVESATCKNQVCVNHKPISKKGKVIACLPNKVIIEIE